MKRIALAALVCLAVLAAASAAQASALDDVTSALKSSHVYVAPGTEGTTSDTAGQLAAQLNNGDNIAIAILPAGSVSGDLSGFASKLDHELGGKAIIGLAVGDQVIAYSSLLPAGVAGDLMHSAQNVSTNTVETLITFIQNVHNWQAQNPTAPASHSQKKHAKKSDGFPVWVIILIVLVVIGGIATYVLTRESRRDPITGEEYIKFRSPVRDDLEKIADMRQSIEDSNLRVLVTQVCTDVEAYFRKYTTDRAADASTFNYHLECLQKVLEKYIDVQNSPERYYDSPKAELLQSGYEAVEGFEQFVLDSIHRGSREALTEFHVNTDILSARSFG